MGARGPRRYGNVRLFRDGGRVPQAPRSTIYQLCKTGAVRTSDFKGVYVFSLGTDPHVHDNIEHLEIETWKDHNLTRADLGWETAAVRVCGSALVFDCRKA